MDFMQVSAGFV